VNDSGHQLHQRGGHGLVKTNIFHGCARLLKASLILKVLSCAHLNTKRGQGQLRSILASHVMSQLSFRFDYQLTVK
jgi:hypothetical protein